MCSRYRYTQIHAEQCYTGITIALPWAMPAVLIDLLPLRLHLSPCVFVHALEDGQHPGREGTETPPDDS